MRTNLFKIVICVTLMLSFTRYSDACTNVLITKGASIDKSVMVTYSADAHVLYGELYFRPAKVWPKGSMLAIYEWDTGKYLGEIAQVENTYQTVGNMNEHQVTITETTFGGRRELHDPDGIVDYGSLIYITLQRAKTAREAIKIMTDMVAQYGYASSGESFSIADKDEVWILELIGKGSKKIDGKNVNKGAVWVAVQIPDGYISAHANQSRIHQFLKTDKKNSIYSPDVISFAREMGYFNGPDEEFSFCDAYAPLDFGALRGCEARVWAVFNILGRGVIGEHDSEYYLDYAMGKNKERRMPLYIKPGQKVWLKEVADVMRDHYEGTPMDMTYDIGAGGEELPYRWRPMYFEVDGVQYLNERAIATQQTGFWILCQSRNWLPDEIGGVLWFGVDDAATSCLTPIYTSSIDIPACFAEGNGDMLTYSETSAFWLFSRVANAAYLRYNRIAPEIMAVADDHELTCVDEIPKIDQQAYAALKKDPQQARRILTDYSLRKADEMFKKWKELDTYLLVKYIDGNIKKQNEDGSFQYNSHTQKIPANPTQPGYSTRWKRAVVKEHGETLKVNTDL